MGMADDPDLQRGLNLPPLYQYHGYGGAMTESPAQDAAMYQRHLQQFGEDNRAVARDTIRDTLMLPPLGAGIATTLHGLRGLGRVLRGSSFMPYESGGIGLGWQGAKVGGGAALTLGANAGMDNPYYPDRINSFLNAVRAGMALEREKKSGQ